MPLPTPSADSRLIYVNAQSGNDATGAPSTPAQVPDPLNPPGTIKPYKTMVAAFGQVRGGFADWILLRGGDSFPIASLTWNKSGRSPTERHVVTTYGDGPRAQLTIGTSLGMYLGWNQTPGSNLIFYGVEWYSSLRDPGSPTFNTSGSSGLALQCLSPSKDVTFEDCRLRFVSMAIQKFTYGAPERFTFRRNIIVDTYGLGGHQQGLFTAGVVDLLIEENTFDHNGWHPSIPGAGRSMFNHNIYVSSGVRTTVRGNVLARGSLMGLKLRTDDAGGMVQTLVEDNLFIENVSGSMVQGDAFPPFAYHDTTFRNNVFTQLGGTASGITASFGVSLASMKKALFEGNLFIHKQNIGTSSGITFWNGTNDPQEDVVIKNNILYNWLMSQGQTFIPPARTGVTIGSNDINRPSGSYMDPGRTVTGYANSIGLASLGDFYGQLRGRARDTWNPALTAKACNDWLRAGFGAFVPPSDPPPPPPSDPPPPPPPDPEPEPLPPPEDPVPTPEPTPEPTPGTFIIDGRYEVTVKRIGD